MAGGLVLQIGHRVLGDEHKAIGGDQVIDAVVDLRVHVIGAARHDEDGPVLLPGLGDELLGLTAQVVLIVVIGGIGRLHRRRRLPLGDLELLGKPRLRPLGKVVGAVQTEIGIKVADLFQVGHVGGQQLGVIGHHGTVIVVVALPLVKVIGHAGIEDVVHPRLHQGLHMAVEQLGGVAHRVGGDGALALEIELPAGLRGQDHLEIQVGEQGEPEGQVLVHVQAEGDAHGAPAAVSGAVALHGAELGVFIPHQVGLAAGLLPQGAGAPVARDEAAAPVEGIHREGAVVGTQAAGGRAGLVGKVGQSVRRKQAAVVQVHIPGGQCRAEGAHQPGDGGPGHVPAQLLLKGPQHRVV